MPHHEPTENAGTGNEETENRVVDELGMPVIDPPEGGPNADPDAPDPGDLVPPLPGPPQEVEQSGPKQD
ncbi:hypothetical protein [Pseudonocardia thermophila]|uniref:hypothetical protein n=1 Tax=Pseudonocardia thermophila TaxID=1848 RepID=UPI00248EB3D8|nr:hypothetical protein [Pseudonocardia thermophila]